MRDTLHHYSHGVCIVGRTFGLVGILITTWMIQSDASTSVTGTEVLIVCAIWALAELIHLVTGGEEYCDERPEGIWDIYKIFRD